MIRFSEKAKIIAALSVPVFFFLSTAGTLGWVVYDVISERQMLLEERSRLLEEQRTVLQSYTRLQETPE